MTHPTVRSSALLRRKKPLQLNNTFY